MRKLLFLGALAASSCLVPVAEVHAATVPNPVSYYGCTPTTGQLLKFSATDGRICNSGSTLPSGLTLPTATLTSAQVAFANGSAAAPSATFGTSGTLGFYKVTTGTVAFAPDTSSVASAFTIRPNGIIVGDDGTHVPNIFTINTFGGLFMGLSAKFNVQEVSFAASQIGGYFGLGHLCTGINGEVRSIPNLYGTDYGSCLDGSNDGFLRWCGPDTFTCDTETWNIRVQRVGDQKGSVVVGSLSGFNFVVTSVTSGDGPQLKQTIAGLPPSGDSTVIADTQITACPAGVCGGTGTYTTNVSQTVASTSLKTVWKWYAPSAMLFRANNFATARGGTDSRTPSAMFGFCPIVELWDTDPNLYRFTSNPSTGTPDRCGGNWIADTHGNVNAQALSVAGTFYNTGRSYFNMSSAQLPLTVDGVTTAATQTRGNTVVASYNDTAGGGRNYFVRSAAANPGSFTALSSGDTIWNQNFVADNGVDFSSVVATFRYTVASALTSGSFASEARILLNNATPTSFVAIHFCKDGSISTGGSAAGLCPTGNVLVDASGHFFDNGVAIPSISSTSTLTNKTISGASNTLSSIGNSSLTNSSFTLGSTSISLGATQLTVAGLTSLDAGYLSVSGSGLPAALGLYAPTASTMGFATAGVNRMTLSSTLLQGAANASSFAVSFSNASGTVPTIIPNRNGSTNGIGAQANTNFSGIIASTEIWRTSAAVFKMIAGGLQLQILTVSGLPTCNAGAEGTFYGVSDALAPTFLGTLVGGGAVHSGAYCNGTNWVGG